MPWAFHEDFPEKEKVRGIVAKMNQDLGCISNWEETNLKDRLSNYKKYEILKMLELCILAVTVYWIWVWGLSGLGKYHRRGMLVHDRYSSRFYWSTAKTRYTWPFYNSPWRSPNLANLISCKKLRWNIWRKA